MAEKEPSNEWSPKKKYVLTTDAGRDDEFIVLEAACQEKKFNLWEFVNSSFFLWFLTTVIVAAATQLYQHQQEKTALENKVKAIDLEIESRLSQFLMNSEPLIQFLNDSTYAFLDDSCQKIFVQLWNELKSPPEKNKYIFTVHQEYEKTSVVSLMALLSNTLSDLGHDINEAKENGVSNWKDFEPKEIADEREYLKTSVRVLIKPLIQCGDTNKKIDVMNLFKSFFGMPAFHRWQWTYPYVDCGYKHPFC